MFIIVHRMIDRLQNMLRRLVMPDTQLHLLCQQINDLSRREWEAHKARELIQQGQELGRHEVLDMLHDMNEQIPQMLETFSQISQQLPSLTGTRPVHRPGYYARQYSADHSYRPGQSGPLQQPVWSRAPRPDRGERTTGQGRLLSFASQEIEIEWPEENDADMRLHIADDVANLRPEELPEIDPNETQKVPVISQLLRCEHKPKEAS